MLRLAGALLLAGGAAAIGLLAAGRLTQRVKSLRALLAALELMERELAFRLTPMPELLALVAARAGPPVNQFFACCREGMGDLGEKSLAQIWRGALEAVPMELGEAECATMAELGDVLGRYDGAGQLEAIGRTRAQLGQDLGQAELQREKHGRVYCVLGLTAGAFLVILLL